VSSQVFDFAYCTAGGKKYTIGFVA
jgi:hypothetical protein